MNRNLDCQRAEMIFQEAIKDRMYCNGNLQLSMLASTVVYNCL